MRIKISLLLFLFISISAAGQNMNYFAGHWHFEGWLLQNHSDTPDFAATWTVEKGFDSTFALVGYVTLNGRANTRELISWNPTTSQYVRTIIAADGSYYVLTTDGWRDKKLLWQGHRYSATETVQLKEEITWISDTEFKAVFYIYDTNWRLISRESLRREE